MQREEYYYRHFVKAKYIISFVFLSILLLSYLHASASVSNNNQRHKMLCKYQSIEIPFIENIGQIKNSNIHYYTKTASGSVFVTKHGQILYAFQDISVKKSTQGCSIKEIFIGSSISGVMGEKETATKVNYFKGNDPANWKKQIPTYHCVNLGEIIEGIHLKLKAHGNNIEKIFLIKPHASPEKIKMKIKGSNNLNVNANGELIIETDAGEIHFTKPVGYQKINGQKKQINVAYTVSKDTYGFTVGNYDKTKDLVIDPLIASTFIGGSSDDDIDNGYSIVQDHFNNVFVIGTTHSFYSDIPNDIIIHKLDENLENLIATTFLGGTGMDELYNSDSVTVDKNGNIFIAGMTESADFPTTEGAFDKTFNGGHDSFVAKLDNNLVNLLASTYIGGSLYDYASAMYEGDGYIYLAGWTNSSDFPTTTSAYDNTYNGGGFDAFAMKFDTSLKNLIASTFVGGSGVDLYLSIAIDQAGDIYLSGATESNNFPTTVNAFDETLNGGFDAVVSKFSGDLQNLTASSYIGGSNDDVCFRDSEYYFSYSNIGLLINSNGYVYLASRTKSSDFPIKSNSYDSLCGTDGNCNFDGSDYAGDGFVIKLNSSLSDGLEATYIGGALEDEIWSISTDQNGNIVLVGRTLSSDFPTTSDAFDNTYNDDPACTICGDGFLTMLDNKLNRVVSSTFLGGKFYDSMFRIWASSNQSFFIVGSTDSYDFPSTPNAYDTSFNGWTDICVIKFEFLNNEDVALKSMPWIPLLLLDD